MAVTYTTPADKRLKRQFYYYRKKLESKGVYAGTKHKRIAIDKSRIPLENLSRLGFVPVTLAIPESGQDQFTSYRNPYNNYHIHSHPGAWTMHEDEHPAATMIMRSRPTLLGKLQAIAEGVPHIITEGIPGAAIYVANQVKRVLPGAGDPNMLNAISTDQQNEKNKQTKTAGSLNAPSFDIYMSKVAALRSTVDLQEHQKDLVRKSRSNRAGIIANWQTGGGKTPGSIAVAEDRGGKVLAVVPAALRENYRQGVAKFTTDDRHNDYHIVSYEKFTKDPHGIVDSVKPRTMIIDEYHRLRNPGKSRDAVASVRSKIPYMVANTASLINNRPEELVPLVNLVAGKRVYGENEFAAKHIGTEKVRAGGILGFLKPTGVKEKITNADELKRRMGPYVHRFTGTAGFKRNFPSKKEEDIIVDMSKEQDRMYRAILSTNKDLAEKIKNNLPPSKQDLANINAFSVALRQISNTPAAYDVSLDAIASSPKMQEVIRRQHQAAKSDPNFRAVVYSNFLNAGISPVIEHMKSKGVAGEVFRGGMSDRERADVVKRFNEGKIKSLGVSPAGGEGLDLRGTKMIQLLEPHWNPERHEQAIGRGVRFKSHEHLPLEERNVAIQRFVSRHPETLLNKLRLTKRDTSIDEWMLSRMKEKKELSDQFINALS